MKSWLPRALDHVAGQRKRAAGESDQRHFVVERAPDLRHRIEHVAQVIVRDRAR